MQVLFEDSMTVLLHVSQSGVRTALEALQTLPMPTMKATAFPGPMVIHLGALGSSIIASPGMRMEGLSQRARCV